jgi:hypothetical protein
MCCHIGRFHEGRLAHEQAMRSNPKNRTYNLEYIYLYSGDFARAEEAAQAWLREATGNRNAFTFAAQPPLLTGDLNLAEQRLAAGLKLYSDEPWLLSLQGTLHARRKETSAALEFVRGADLLIPWGMRTPISSRRRLRRVGRRKAGLPNAAFTGNPCWPFFKLIRT